MFKEDSLLSFDNIKEFQEFMSSFDIYNGWEIRSGLLNTRGKAIENRSYVKFFIELFSQKEFFYRKVSLAEVVSWLDSLYLIQKVFSKLYTLVEPSIYNKISVSCEYMIRMSKRMRIDYILQFDDTLLLLEFRTVNTFEKIRTTWQNKFLELIIYKELLGNYIVYNDVRLYAFIALYEYHENKLVLKHRKYNNDQIEYLAKYIKMFLCKIS